MEDMSVKAIIMGVTIFVTMAVISALMIYFNTARGVVDAVNKKVSASEAYDNIMNEDVFTDTLTGVEIRSLINKYMMNDTVTINIVKISGQNVEDIEESGANINYRNINISWVANEKIQEKYLDLINPIWSCSVEKVESESKTTLDISLDVDEDILEEE